MRIVLCENGLIDSQGHHFNLAAGLKEELAARDIPLAVWAHVAIDPRFREELGATATFEWSPYDPFTSRTRSGHIRRFLVGARKFGSALVRGDLRPDDVLLITCARPAEILGIATSLRRGGVQPCAQRITSLRFPTGRDSTRIGLATF